MWVIWQLSAGPFRGVTLPSVNTCWGKSRRLKSVVRLNITPAASYMAQQGYTLCCWMRIARYLFCTEQKLQHDVPWTAEGTIQYTTAVCESVCVCLLVSVCVGALGRVGLCLWARRACVCEPTSLYIVWIQVFIVYRVAWPFTLCTARQRIKTPEVSHKSITQPLHGQVSIFDEHWLTC